jgi:phage portal protein BeeE
VPPHKVMHLLRATFTNIEHQSIEVVVDSITPWALRFEQEADYKLFGQNRQGFFTSMDLKGLLRGDFKSRQEGLQIMRRNGALNADEWRRLEDMNETGVDGGKKYLVEANMTTLEQVGNLPMPAADPQPSADEPDQTPVQRAREQAQRARLH